MIDTHAHLDGCVDPPAALLARARAAGVDRVVTIGCGVASCRDAVRIAEAETGVFAALGIHPHQAGEATAADLDELGLLLAHPLARAVGETGLDYYRDYAPHDLQRELFTRQMELAASAGLALVVHSRAAEEDTVAMLERHPAALPVILHCFSSPALLEPALERRYFVSFAGNVTFPKAVELRLAAGLVPADRLLAETDCPYLAPQAHRGAPNEPAYVTHVVEALARVRGVDRTELERQLDANASAAFGLP